MQHAELAHQLLSHSQLFQSRKVINTIYLIVPPLGLLFMFLSPFFSTRERLSRTAVTASFIAFFAVMGPDLRSYMEVQMAFLATH